MNILLAITAQDMSYLSALKQYLPIEGKHKAVIFDATTTPVEFKVLARKYDAVVTTSHIVCGLVTGKKFKPTGALGSGATISNFQGNLLIYDNIKVLVIQPLKQLYTTNTGHFLTARYIKKITNPEVYLNFPKFSWTLVNTTDKRSQLYKVLQSPDCLFTSVDIEVSTKIYCIGFGVVTKVGATITIDNFVVPLTSVIEYEYLKILLDLPVAKCFQNGKFDVTFLTHYSMPVNNYIWDTMYLFHSTYSELPKRLDFLASYYLVSTEYWKDEIHSDNLHDKYAYNAKDVYNTACILVAQLMSIPAYAKRNYCLKFPQLPVNIAMGLEGFAIDITQKTELVTHYEAQKSEALRSLQTALSWDRFNPNSPKQVLALIQLLANKNATSSDEATLQKAMEVSPLMAWLADRILTYRGATKIISTYLETLDYKGRLLYSINPFGTDTGRSSSSSSDIGFAKGKSWTSYGTNIQNFPRIPKRMLRADAGYVLVEIDKKSSESYCTAELSGDTGLQHAVYNSPDFHCHNASMFFGIPFEKLFDAATGKKLNEPLRDIAKRINHGANYNMGASVLLETMGVVAVLEAKRLILVNLPTESYAYKRLVACVKPIDIAEYLLSLFDKAYPKVRGSWQREVTKEVITTGKISSPSGWTRRCFGKPDQSKPDLNAYMAHGAQHLSVEIVNMELVKIFNTVVLPNYDKIQLKAQIHDSIVMQIRTEHVDELVEKVEALMHHEVIVKGRTLSIPNDVSKPKEFWK